MLTAAPLSVCSYHCRMAKVCQMFLPNCSVYKFYFLPFGGLLPISHYFIRFDPYPFPHITIFFLSFIIGHLALLGNCLIYPFRYYHNFLYELAAQCGVDDLYMNGFCLLSICWQRFIWDFYRSAACWQSRAPAHYLLVSIVLRSSLLVSEIFKRVEQTKHVTQLI